MIRLLAAQSLIKRTAPWSFATPRVGVFAAPASSLRQTSCQECAADRQVWRRGGGTGLVVSRESAKLCLLRTPARLPSSCRSRRSNLPFATKPEAVATVGAEILLLATERVRPTAGPVTSTAVGRSVGFAVATFFGFIGSISAPFFEEHASFLDSMTNANDRSHPGRSPSVW